MSTDNKKQGIFIAYPYLTKFPQTLDNVSVVLSKYELDSSNVPSPNDELKR